MSKNKKKGGKKKPSSTGSPSLSVSDSAGTTGSDTSSPAPVNKTVEANPSPLNNATGSQPSPSKSQSPPKSQSLAKDSIVADAPTKAPAVVAGANPSQQPSTLAKDDGKPCITVTTATGEQQLVTSTNATSGDPAKCMCLTQEHFVPSALIGQYFINASAYATVGSRGVRSLCRERESSLPVFQH
ncbi:hypothetical protein PSACC_03153 [Paramicrosporidium saccamoebae]|uniref:Uncharacterized protein n=1 Tax=Paramicrosporidium saccamoebae TaxID=1246581 RepID=A0A2H9THD5_9FUNG|nr:hypothetical protein PSACC_03153 [Paramicrosporidium saccamoebae]